jgi:hypothetical protein
MPVARRAHARKAPILFFILNQSPISKGEQMVVLPSSRSRLRSLSLPRAVLF